MDHPEDRHARRQHRCPTRNDYSGSGKKGRCRDHQRLRSKRRQTTGPDGINRPSSTRQKDDSSRYSPRSRPSGTRIPLQDHRWRHKPSRRSRNRHSRSRACEAERTSSKRWSTPWRCCRGNWVLREILRRPKDPHVKTKDGFREISITRQSCTPARGSVSTRNHSSQKSWS